MPIDDFIVNNYDIAMSIAQKGVFFLATIFGLSAFHWIFMKIYISICVDLSIWGLITNVIYMGSPVCHFINQVQYEISKYYSTIWASIVLSFVTWITVSFRNCMTQQHAITKSE